MMLNQSKLKKLTQPSKKVRCPVTFAVKKFYSFPEYKISADTKRHRTNVSMKLRDILSNILKSCLLGYNFYFWLSFVEIPNQKHRK